MPEIDFDDPRTRFAKGRGPEAFANARRYFATVRGRPRKGQEPAGSTARSLRLPDEAWTELEREAAKRKMSLHKLLRAIVAEHLYLTAKVPPRKPTKRRAHRAA
jgi:hypothetical protein